MTKYQQFATGFIAECLARELTIPEMTKAADDAIARLKTAGVGDLLGSAFDVAKVPALLALAAPPLVGAGLGHALARSTDIDPKTEVEDIHHREKMDAYQSQTDRLNRLVKLQRAARKIPRPAMLSP